MKINKYTAVLAALGVVSLGSLAQANTIIYMTGSTAARGNIFTALTTAKPTGEGMSVVSPSPNNTSSASQVVFEGQLSNGDTVDVVCTWSGSEAGIASTAGQGLYQVLPLDPNGSGSTLNGGKGYALPGVGAGLQFLVGPAAGGNWTTTHTLPISGQGTQTTPDITMADTSQAVSFTPANLFPLHEFGAVAVVPFTFMKGYEATPDTAWNNIVNITTAGANVLASTGDSVNASFIDGVATDNTDGVAFIGRNFGSGTRMNFLLSGCLLTPNSTVDQWAFDGNNSGTLSALYPSSTPGTLTFPGATAAPQQLVDIGNDGYDSGKYVGYTLNVDGTGCQSVLLGYLGISDAKNASGAGLAPGGHAATYIKYNGIYESDTAVEQGNYTYWGYEHIYGTTVASSADATQFGTDLKTVLANNISTLGGATGDVSTNPSQSALIPLTAMKVSRGSAPNYKDSGFPH